MTDWNQLDADKAELKLAWKYLELPWEYPQSKVPLWLMDHGLTAVLSGFRVLKAKEDTVKDPAAFLATCLRNAKKRSMTAEQREAEISQMRSAIGKIGAAKAHAKEISYLKDEFAKVISEDAD